MTDPITTPLTVRASGAVATADEALRKALDLVRSAQADHAETLAELLPFEQAELVAVVGDLEAAAAKVTGAALRMRRMGQVHG